jgi:hypothetical protein
LVQKTSERNYNAIVDSLIEVAPPYNKGSESPEERVKKKARRVKKLIVKQKIKRRKSLRLIEQ